MEFSLPLFIGVRPDTLQTILACAKRVQGFPADGAQVRAAVAAVEQLVADRQPADPVVVERVFTQRFVPSFADTFRPGSAEVSVEEVAVLLAYAKREIDHVGWCFDARDDEDLENQLPSDSVETCPVCHSAYEIEKHVRHVDVWRRTCLDGVGRVMHHQKNGADEEGATGHEPG